MNGGALEAPPTQYTINLMSQKNTKKDKKYEKYAKMGDAIFLQI